MEMVKEKLRQEGIRVVAEDTSGNYVRTIKLDTCMGEIEREDEGRGTDYSYIMHNNPLIVLYSYIKTTRLT